MNSFFLFLGLSILCNFVLHLQNVRWKIPNYKLFLNLTEFCQNLPIFKGAVVLPLRLSNFYWTPERNCNVNQWILRQTGFRVLKRTLPMWRVKIILKQTKLEMQYCFKWDRFWLPVHVLIVRKRGALIHSHGVNR